MNKTKFQVLSELDHIRKRPGMYIGSVVTKTKEEYIVDTNKFKLTNLTYNPGVLKCINEVIDNVIDEHKRNNKLNQLKVEICSLTNTIVVEDNGGIPVELNKELGVYIPEMIFGMLRSGSNFDDSTDQSMIGTNGLGAKLAAIFSESFTVETADGKKYFHQTYTDGLKTKSEPKVSASGLKFTRITFSPDPNYFDVTIDSDFIKKIETRLYEIAACNPKLKCYLNSDLITCNSFESLASMYDDKAMVFEVDGWKMSLSNSVTGDFEHVSFVNSVKCDDGGTHVDYAINQVIVAVRDFIKRKTKQDILPGAIKSNLRFILSCDINRPKFDSQTKSRMISAPKDFGSSFSIDEKLTKKLQKSDVIAAIIEWAERKKLAEELKEAKKLNREADKANLKLITKYETATERKDRSQCVLVVCEGDSAAKPIQSARNPKLMGVFPLKGKPMNIAGMPLKKIMENEEFTNLMMILGLKLGEKADLSTMRYGKLLIASDSDADGIAIRGLIISNFYRLWPELYEHDFIQVLKTPVAIAKQAKKENEFFTVDDMKKWELDNAGSRYQLTYFKGLGSHNTDAFRKFLGDASYIETVSLKTAEDIQAIHLAFDKDKADDRKAWIMQ